MTPRLSRASAQDRVTDHHADLHGRHGRRLVDETQSRTFYQFGCLYFAVETGCFRADMRVSVENDGPVTIVVDSKRLF